MDYKDYYQILGVDRKADDKEIKRAYRKLAMQYHPDRNQGKKEAEEKFKEINEAYQVLSDPDKRAHYNRLGSAYSNHQQSGNRGGFNWDEWSTGARGGGTRVEYSGDIGDLFGESGSFSDFFSSIFGGGGGFSSEQGQQNFRPQIREHEVQISLHEAYNGSSRQVELDGKRLEVKIPAGARTGTKVRMKGVGPRGINGQPSDIFLVIKVAPDPRFKRKGNNLYSDVTIDLYTAVLGGEVEVPSLGRDIRLTIPAGTQAGQTFRLNGKGMPHLKKPAKKGDLLAKVHVSIPEKLSSEEKKLFEKLSDLKK